MEQKRIKVNDDIEMKPVELSDARLIFETVDKNREHLRVWLPFVDFTLKVEDEEGFIKSITSGNDVWNEDVFLIYYKKEFAGLISLKFNRLDKPNKKTEIGYWLAENFQKKGIITECCRRLIKYSFEDLGLNRVTIKIASGNATSIKVAERLNLKFEGVEREGELLACGFVDLNVYSILRKEFMQAKFT